MDYLIFFVMSLLPILIIGGTVVFIVAMAKKGAFSTKAALRLPCGRGRSPF